jgi:hypothetical protein
MRQTARDASFSLARHMAEGELNSLSLAVQIL